MRKSTRNLLVLSLAACLFALMVRMTVGALPNQLQSARMTSATLASTIATNVGNLEVAITDILGIPIDTNISAAGFVWAAAGLSRVVFQPIVDGSPATGQLWFSSTTANTLKYYDGTSTRSVVDLSLSQTLTNKTLTSPVIANVSPGTDFTLTQNGVVPFTSVNLGAVANTLYLSGGHVGIGTSIPNYPLHVSTSVTNDVVVKFENTNAISGYGLLVQTAANDATRYSFAALGNGGNNVDFKVFSNGIIYARSNVGIGTTSPGALLDVGLAGTTLGVIRLEGSTSGYVALQPNAVAGSVSITFPASSGTVALTANNLGVFASTTSAQLAAIISDKTGSAGSLVFSTGPTISGPTLSGIVAGTPTWASTQSLNTSGNAATVTTNANLTGPITSVGNTTSIASQTGTGTKFVMDTNPSIIGGTIAALTSFGVRSTGTGAFDLKLANTENLTVSDKTLTVTLNNANRTLTVAGDATVSGTNTGDQTITLTGGVTGSGTGSFVATVVTNANLTGPITSVGNTTSIASQTGTGTKFVMDTNPTLSGTLTIGGSGNGVALVNAGTANHQYRVTNTGGDGAFGLFNSVGGGLGNGGLAYATALGSENLTALILFTNGTSRMTIDTTGKVGIGTTTPGALLDIGLAGTTLGVIRLEGSTSGYVALQPNAVAGNVIITFPATTGTVALTANDLSVFAATTSAQLAGVISDETGSGALVFGTSPSFTTPSLGAATATTIDASTSFGVTTTATRIRTSLATPASLVNGDWWVECSGTTPNRVCAIKVQDGSATRTLASAVY